ncbi:S-adenosyl-L-methionine-dependent methyltransferase [Truncatella angustata]|uniref:S-adenosyl-L-methionine-dependent methyltransferase n=1 Tax=Truncatella angustata TaxID=152316 RepID=A0A9P8UPS6_9PEZI|nr:S-adenosyl-L-methionine-dependent methyltransferase [Truncatella angustata]KAH6655834.1 S-adenosyl-L-methionine-dependent methyltransferase [Truncatella angustata]
MPAAPSHLFTEDVPKPELDNPESDGLLHPHHSGPHANFAERANALVNATLGRTPDGASVIDPDSILDESGRLYHGYKDGKYLLPNDAAEQDRLDVQHKVCLLALDGWLALAPYSRTPKHVLDIATGTGIWALDYAERYPDAEVIGIDLSAIQPDRGFPNCSFQKDDAEADWVFREAGKPDPILFDYVHARLVMSCFDDTRNVMRHAFKNMQPGGWIEFQDIVVDTWAPNNLDSPFARWWDSMNQGAFTIGRDLNRPKSYKKWLEEVGFVDVRERKIITPCNPWPKDKKWKEIGAFQLLNLFEGMRPIAWKMLRLAGWEPEAIDALITEAKEYLRNIKNHPTADL